MPSCSKPGGPSHSNQVIDVLLARELTPLDNLRATLDAIQTSVGAAVVPDRESETTGEVQAATAGAREAASWRRSTAITWSCCSSLSSGKIGRLSTSAQSRSVVGRLPGP